MRLVLRVLGFLVLGIVVVVLVAAGLLWLNSQRVLSQRFDRPTPGVTVARTPDQVARGAYMVSAFPGCAGCHSSNPQATRPVLDGNLMQDLIPLGHFYAPNLTPGGPLRDWSDGEVIRAIREGIAKDGRGLAVMPSGDFRFLSDEDVQSVVAYLRSQPAVTKDSPPISLSPLGVMLVGTGQLQLSVQPPTGQVSAPARGPTGDYGSYLVHTTGCAACHGPKLDGQNQPPGPPKGPTLRVVRGWSEEQFVQTLRTGTDPSSHALSDLMPWSQYGRGTDDDLRAVYQYLHGLP